MIFSTQMSRTSSGPSKNGTVYAHWFCFFVTCLNLVSGNVFRSMPFTICLAIEIQWRQRKKTSSCHWTMNYQRYHLDVYRPSPRTNCIEFVVQVSNEVERPFSFRQLFRGIHWWCDKNFSSSTISCRKRRLPMSSSVKCRDYKTQVEHECNRLLVLEENEFHVV